VAETKDLETRFKELAERNAKLMALLEAKHESESAGGLTADQLEGILTRSSAAAAKAAGHATEILASKLKPENVDHLQRGPFEHPEGGIKHPKPALVREIIWGKPLTIEELTYAEVLACNALSASLDRSQRRLARDGKWVAFVSDDNQRLTIRVPVKTIDDRQDLPSFIGIVTELTNGEKPLDQGAILSELALLKAEMALLRGTATA
jgi:hypothetical protein